MEHISKAHLQLPLKMQSWDRPVLSQEPAVRIRQQQTNAARSTQGSTTTPATYHQGNSTPMMMDNEIK